MSLIACAAQCVYQTDGYCNLNEIPCSAGESGGADCSYFIQRGGKNKKRGGETDGSAAEKP